jgi:hypothetical protein
MDDHAADHVREQDPPTLDVERLLPIVVGAHLDAEVHDRPLAARLRNRIITWQRDGHDECDDPLEPIVLTDLWYLNQQPLRLRPTIAIGPPEVNAATAYLAGKVATAFVAEDQFRIQLDPELIDERTCLWGSTPAATSRAVDLFAERYLEAFLRAIHRLPSDVA